MTSIMLDTPAVQQDLGPADQPGRPWAPRRIDAIWWTTAHFAGKPVAAALRRRDVTTIFRFLKARGWSTSAMAAATGLSENRVRAVTQGKQTIMSYDVLERVAQGLAIDRGLMGLAYTTLPCPGAVPSP